MKKSSCVVVTPRFENGSFTGYDQCGGNVYLDTAGHLYGLVCLEDYNEMRTKLEWALLDAEAFIVHALKLDHVREGSTKELFEELLKNIQDVVNDRPELE